MNADVCDATSLEGDEKLPNVMDLQLLNVQEPSLEQDAGNDVFPPVLKNVKVINQLGCQYRTTGRSEWS